MPADNEFENEEEPDVDLCAQTIRDFVLHPVFEAFILVTIIVNGVTMVKACRRPRSLASVCSMQHSTDCGATITFDRHGLGRSHRPGPLATTSPTGEETFLGSFWSGSIPESRPK